MPWPSVEPMPFLPSESRACVPEDEQDASYFAASARIANFSRTPSLAMRSPSCEVPNMGLARFDFTVRAGFSPGFRRARGLSAGSR